MAILLATISILSIGCSQGATNVVVPIPESKALSSPPEINSASEEGFVDCVFYFDRIKTVGNGISISPLAMSKGTKVGFTIQYDKNWSAQPEIAKDVKINLRTGGVTLQRSGAESDDFVATLAKLYGKTVSAKKMNDSIHFNAVCMKGDPTNLDAGLVSIKMFVDSEVEAKYGEFFLDIDASAHSIRLGEKDPEYRLPILKALINPNK